MRWGDRRVAAGLVACGLVAGLVVAPTVGAGKGKRKVQVHPGKNAIAKALDRADAGDVLRIHGGRYEETLEIDQRVRLVAAGKRRPVIDGGCSTRSTIAAQADRVRLRGLKVVGGLAFEIDYNGVSGGRVNKVIVRDTCDALYGVNVFNTGPMKIVKSKALGFDDAGFYVGAISDTGSGAIVVRRNEAYGNVRGVIVEDSAGVDIRVRNNDLHDNRLAGGVGIFLHSSDGILIERNDTIENGRFGIHLDPNSDGNVLNDNRAVDNPTDLLDEGSGNCGSGNSFETGDAIPPC